MSLRKADGPLMVQVPSAGQDRPSWLGVGAIAVVGFVIGVAWPRLAGVRLGPSVPESASATVGEGEPAASVAALPTGPAVTVTRQSPIASTPVGALLAAPTAAPLATPASGIASGTAAGTGARISVAHGAVFACKTASGESLKGADCGTVPGLDGLILPRLRKLADCPDAAAAAGKVRLVVRADFARDAVTVDLGRDPGLDRATAEPLLTCARTAMASANLDGIAHDNARYSVAYTVSFAGAGANTSATAATASSPSVTSVPSGPASQAAASPANDGTAQVQWEVAIVRDAPKTGKVLARLQRGTTLHVGAVKDGWYPVKYGDGFGSDGWVYRGAIGR